MSEPTDTTEQARTGESPPPVTDETPPPEANASSPPAAEGTAVSQAIEVPPALAEEQVTPESIVEALLFATDSALSAGKIAQLIGIGTAGDVKKHIETLNQRYEAVGCAFHVQPISNGFQMFTRPAFDPWISKLHKARAQSRLSQAALETLAIVAYKQPVLRVNIEAIRGVAVGDMLVRLREMKLIKIVGRAEEIGRPLLYGTTPRFLEVFGLATLKDLPKLDEDHPEQVPKLQVAKAP